MDDSSSGMVHRKRGVSALGVSTSVPALELTEIKDRSAVRVVFTLQMPGVFNRKRLFAPGRQANPGRRSAL
jgi:hypothetical protein